MDIACLDLEGVLVPEIWIDVAERTGIDALRKTTREVASYEALMDERIAHLRAHRLRLGDIQAVIDTMDPLAGAQEFLDRLRKRYQVVILSDTFYEFAAPLMAKLGWPTLFCHHLEVDEQGSVCGYRLRQPDPKRAAVRALRSLDMRIVAAGDSFNDLSMLEEADAGVFFRAPESIASRFPQYPSVQHYQDLEDAFAHATTPAL